MVSIVSLFVYLFPYEMTRFSLNASTGLSDDQRKLFDQTFYSRQKRQISDISRDIQSSQGVNITEFSTDENDYLPTFVCECAGTGFYGGTCEINNICEPEPCLNGGSCTDSSGYGEDLGTENGFYEGIWYEQYTCECPQYFYGDNCERYFKCDSAPREIIWVVDGSDSVGQSNYDKQVGFIKDVTGNLDLSENGTRAAFVQFTIGDGETITEFYSAFKNDGPTTSIWSFLEIFRIIFGRKNQNFQNCLSGSPIGLVLLGNFENFDFLAENYSENLQK